MSLFKSLCIALCLSASVTSTLEAQQTTRYEILDRQGFGKPLTAYTVELPPGWQARGEILWQKPCSGNDLYELDFYARSPDGLTGLRIQPGHQIIWLAPITAGMDPSLVQMMAAQTEAQLNQLRTRFRNSNCHVGLVTGTQQLFDTLVKPARPADMKVTATTHNADQKKHFETMFGATGGTGMDTFFDAVRVDMTYALGAQQIEESLWMSWYAFQPAANDPVMAGSYQQTIVEPLRLTWLLPSRRAQDQAALDALVRSIKVDPDWQARIQEVQRKVAENNRRAADENRRANQESWDQRQADRARAEAQRDAEHRRFLDMIAQ